MIADRLGQFAASPNDRVPLRQVDFVVLQREIAERKVLLRLDDLDPRLYRDNGLRRSPEKRAFLGRIAERCRQAKVSSLDAHY